MKSTKSKSYSNHKNNYKQQNLDNFKATPIQIFEKLETAKMCPGKRGFLETIAGFFRTIEIKMQKSDKLPAKFDYFLSKENDIPKNLAKTKVRTGFLRWTSLKNFDKELSKETFSCGGASHCSCGKDKSLKEFTQELLEKIGVESPEKITISK